MRPFIICLLTLALVACTSQPQAADAEAGCIANGGTWHADYDECESISAEACASLNGTFEECASACRHNPDAEVCTLQCVQVCTF